MHTKKRSFCFEENYMKPNVEKLSGPDNIQPYRSRDHRLIVRLSLFRAALSHVYFRCLFPKPKGKPAMQSLHLLADGHY